jgi:transaldolase/glucose-6-phosphate isomerase
MNVQARNAAAKGKAAANPLAALHQHGQAPWLDFLARKFIADGSLKTLIERDGVTGVTSNPSIFEKAIGGSGDYDASIKSALGERDRDVMSLYESLAIEDIRNAADVLAPVYKAAKGADGYVSLEVSPYLANDTKATIAEAERLWREVGRDNIMIKVPATPAGLPAIRHLTGEGINVNITLLFSQQAYKQVVEAYLGGLEHLLAQGGDPSKVASVASFFVSRIDVAVDKLIDEKIQGDTSKKDLASLRGKVAIANAKLAYQIYKQMFSGARWDRLKGKGARTQRLLWASTGTKSKELSDVLYVDELIADDTVNTLPPATMDAFRDHGKISDSLEQNLDDAKAVMKNLAQAGISIDDVTRKLVEEGVQLFADAFDKLLGAVVGKRAAILGDKLDAQTAKLPAELDKAVKATLEQWRSAGKVRQLWAGDAKLWTDADEAKWVGWLNIVAEEEKRLDELKALAADVRKQGFTHAVLLGMGGSSLGPEVLAETFGVQKDSLRLIVLDSTDPAQVRSVESKIDPAKTLFIVSSKSGSTLEPNVLKDYFFDRTKAVVGADKAGSHFLAITDPGSSLEKEAKRDRFRHIFYGKPEIGGRYSVLSAFGVVPAAVMGLDLEKFLETTALTVRSCGAHVPPADNPGVMLGVILGEAAKAGRDKLTIIASKGIADFGAWLEQLVAESTGKHGKGIVPVDAEPLGEASAYGKDRVFAYLRLAGKPDAAQDQAVDALEAAGHPVVRIEVTDAYHIGQEFFRWEIATAVAGAVIGINPFDQPDVETSKVQTRELTNAYEKTGSLPPETPFFEADGISLFADNKNVDALGKASSLVGYLKAHLERLKVGDYFALLAYTERNKQHADPLDEIRAMVRDRRHVATCLGFGPRFLHSTGQAYKGGPASGVFLQITCDDARDLAIPGRKMSFGVVKAAQARGDFEVLAQRDRRALRVHIGSHAAGGLNALKTLIREALG